MQMAAMQERFIFPISFTVVMHCKIQKHVFYHTRGTYIIQRN